MFCSVQKRLQLQLAKPKTTSTKWKFGGYITGHVRTAEGFELKGILLYYLNVLHL